MRNAVAVRVAYAVLHCYVPDCLCRIGRWQPLCKLNSHRPLLAVSPFVLQVSSSAHQKTLKPLAQLAVAMRDATYRYDPVSKTITLPVGVSWPDLDSNILYVRFFYKDLWDSESVLMHGCVVQGVVKGAVILGTPGCE